MQLTADTAGPPADFAAALDRVPAARRRFDGLTAGQQRWYVETVEQAEQAETRQRRIRKAVATLAAA